MVLPQYRKGCIAMREIRFKDHVALGETVARLFAICGEIESIAYR
jgi:hypothetical protein